MLRQPADWSQATHADMQVLGSSCLAGDLFPVCLKRIMVLLLLFSSVMQANAWSY